MKNIAHLISCSVYLLLSQGCKKYPLSAQTNAIETKSTGADLNSGSAQSSLEFESPFLFVTYLGNDEMIYEVEPSFMTLNELQDPDEQAGLVLNSFVLAALQDSDGMLEADKELEALDKGQTAGGENNQEASLALTGISVSRGIDPKKKVIERSSSSSSLSSSLSSQSIRSSTRSSSSRAWTNNDVAGYLKNFDANAKSPDPDPLKSLGYLAKWKMIEIFQKPKAYFFKQIPKKYAQAFRDEQAGKPFGFNRIPPKVYTDEELKDLGISEMQIKFVREKLQKQPSIYLSMLPTTKVFKGIIADIKKQRVENRSDQPIDLEMVGIVRQFEIETTTKSEVFKTKVAEVLKSRIKEKAKYQKMVGSADPAKVDIGEAATEEALTALMKSEKITVNWSRIDLPDRQKLDPSGLMAAIITLDKALGEGRDAAVHCKSGQGRSAAAAVGTKALATLRILKRNGVVITKDTIRKVIELEGKSAKDARSQIDISKSGKKLPLEEVLAAFFGLRQDFTPANIMKVYGQ